jgi:hypothetical protein
MPEKDSDVGVCCAPAHPLPLTRAAGALRRFHHLMFPDAALRLPAGVRAVLVKSYGFGQASAELLLVHPARLLATLPPAAYAARRECRRRSTHAELQRVLGGQAPLVRVKTAALNATELRSAVYLNLEGAPRGGAVADGANTCLVQKAAAVAEAAAGRGARAGRSGKSRLTRHPSTGRQRVRGGGWRAGRSGQGAGCGRGCGGTGHVRRRVAARPGGGGLCGGGEPRSQPGAGSWVTG